jgi:hypothetical protein
MTYDNCINLMSDRGYTLMSMSSDRKILNFSNYDNKFDIVSLGATVDLIEEKIELHFTDMKYFMYITSGSFSLNHKDFDKFEKVISMYGRQCNKINPLQYL